MGLNDTKILVLKMALGCDRIDYQYKFNSSKGTNARQRFTNVEKKTKQKKKQSNYSTVKVS